MVDGSGRPVGQVDAVELVTVGQRRGLGLSGQQAGRYAVEVDVAGRQVRVGPPEALTTSSVVIGDPVWAPGARSELRARSASTDTGVLVAQCSAHGQPRPVTVSPSPDGATMELVWSDGPQPRVAPGQSVVLYRDDLVLGGGIVRAT